MCVGRGMTRVTERMARDAFAAACDAMDLPTDPAGVEYADDPRSWHVIRHAPGDRVYWTVWGGGREIMVGLSTRELYRASDLLERIARAR